MVEAKKTDTEALAAAVIEGIKNKKGMGIVKLSLKDIPNAICQYFVICHGTSKPQIEAIAESVDEVVKKKTGFNPWHKEGFENAEWVLIDYVDVVVHIFQEKTRKFYLLEELWADAKAVKYATDE